MMFMPMFSPTIDVQPSGSVLVAGMRLSGGSFRGYDSGWTYGEGVIGSLSEEPIPGVTLLFMGTLSWGFSLDISGDQVALLAGKTLYVNDVAWPLDEATYPPDFYVEATSVGWEEPDAFPVFEDGKSYTIRIE